MKTQEYTAKQIKRMLKIARFVHHTLEDKKRIGDEPLTLYEWAWLRDLEEILKQSPDHKPITGLCKESK